MTLENTKNMAEVIKRYLFDYSVGLGVIVPLSHT